MTAPRMSAEPVGAAPGETPWNPLTADGGLAGWSLRGLPASDFGNPLTGTAVYRFFDVSADLIYIGIARDFGKRWRDHLASKAWYREIHSATVVWYRDKDAASAAETEAIRTENPRENDQHHPAPRKTRPRARQPRSGTLQTPEAKRARSAYRRSVKRGSPLSDREIAKRYGRGRTWAANRIREAETGPKEVKAMTADQAAGS